MLLANIERDAVLEAIAEFDEMGREAFLKKYGFGEAQEYYIEHNDRLYDSKAIVGVAYKYQFPTLGPLRPDQFSGGKATVMKKLKQLGFDLCLSGDTEGRFGPISGYDEGAAFGSRAELSRAGIHRPLQAGICGSSSEGAESIVLSGGYEDDKDFGTEIIYTGHGGRDQTSGKQVADQVLTRGNMALAMSQMTGLPVRVVRGAEHNSEFAPVSGYRYDGLFRVEDHWQERGASGFKVWRFRLVVIPQSEHESASSQDGDASRPSGRRQTTVARIIRDSRKARQVKKLYDFRCQVCGLRIETASGPYAEAAHIKPLGEPHNGPDTTANILCLCPNHHVMFDFGAIAIGDDLTVIGGDGRLMCNPRHKIELEYLRYHRRHYLKDN